MRGAPLKFSVNGRIDLPKRLRFGSFLNLFSGETKFVFKSNSNSNFKNF